MQSINKKALIISIILALFSVFLIFNYLKGSPSKPQNVSYIYTFVAAKTLQPNQMITDSDIKQIKIERDYLNTNAVQNKSNIIGKRLKDRIIEGEQILADRLVGDDKSKMAYVISEGKRAVSININEQSGVSFLPMPGDFVDVAASFDAEDVQNGAVLMHYPKISKIILENIEVLAVGGKIDAADKRSSDPKTVTLAVTPQEAEKLVYASDYATIRLALRRSGDAADANTNGVTRSDVTPNKGVTSSTGTASTSGIKK